MTAQKEVGVREKEHIYCGKEQEVDNSLDGSQVPYFFGWNAEFFFPK